jgi:predicted DNA-binding ribbon-helix-helix protein
MSIDFSEQKEAAEKELGIHSRKLKKELSGRQTTHIRVPVHIHRKLKKTAENDDMTISRLAETIIDHYFREVR